MSVVEWALGYRDVVVAPERTAAPEAGRLASLTASLSKPFVTAREQPPPPGSHALLRGWHAIRQLAGIVMQAIPKGRGWALGLLRLVIALVLWVFILAVAYEVAVLYAVCVLPFVLIVRARRKRRESAQAAPALRPALIPVAVVAGRPQEDLLRALRTAPDPVQSPAVDACPKCGAPTAHAGETCLYCGWPLPMVLRRGWHPDPLGHGRRWFDGTSWTEHTVDPD